VDENWNPVDKNYLMRCYSEYQDAIEFFADLDRGIVTMTLTEYNAMPAKVLDAFRIFQAMAEQRRRKPPDIAMN
jgi:hypothetical protein